MNERGRLLALMAATAGAVVIPLNASMLSVALGPIIDAFGVSVPTGTWLILLYLVVMTSLQPVAGRLGDLFGHARVFSIGLVGFGLASVGAAFAPNFAVLLVARVLQGVAGATLGPNATALIRMVYPAERHGYAMGLYVGAFSVGLTIGPVIGGFLVGALGWQSVFWVNLPVVLSSLLLAARVLPRQSGEWVAERNVEPAPRPNLFRLPGFGAANAAIFLLHAMLFTTLTAVPLYLQNGRGLSPATVGWVVSTLSVTQVVVAPFAGRLSDRLGRRLLVMVGGLLYLVGALILFTESGGSTLIWVVTALALAGTGTGLATPPIQTASVAACPPALTGVGSGIWYSSRYLGNIAGALMTGLLLPSDLSAQLGTLYATVGACAILLTGTAHFLPVFTRRPTAE